MATQKVTFLSPQGIETTRDIESAEQISGFEKSGFKTVSNPFTTPTPNVASPTTQTPNYGGLTSVTPAEQDLVKQGYTPEQIELRRQQSSQGGRINIGQAGQAITSNLANYGIATSALPSIQSRADLMSAQEEAQIRANEEQRKQMLRQQISSDYQGVINRTEKQGEQQIGGAEAQLGISRGLGASSSRMQLVNQMQSDINRDIGELEKAKIAALAKLDFDSADRTEALINQKIEQRGKLQEEAFNQSMRLLQEQRTQAEENQKQQERTLQNIVPNLYNEMLDTENPTAVLQDYSKRYGLDPVAISSALISFGNEQRKDDILASTQSMEAIKQFADLGGTGEFDVPGYGKINVVAKGETGNYIMEKMNGQYVAFDKDTGKIKPLGFSGSDVTSGNLFDAISYISGSTVPINSLTGKNVLVEQASLSERAKQESLHALNLILQGDSRVTRSFANYEDAKKEAQRLGYDTSSVENEVRKDLGEEIKQAEIINEDISMYHPLVQQYLKGIVSSDKLFTGGTANERKRYENEIKNAQNRGINVDTSGITSEEKKETINLRKEFNSQQAVKEYKDISNSISVLESNARMRSAAGDVSMIFSYMKMLDPTSVVREGEQATARNAGAISDKVRNLYNKAISGQSLTDKQRADFIKTARGIRDARKIQYDRTVGEYRQYARELGLKPDSIVTQ